ncbi:MAG TPA: hypothetical protein VHB50_21850 [Bryobacteraceae bacterium]|nr:hypothetical protein [Bryobacteraceae bacterium]
MRIVAGVFASRVAAESLIPDLRKIGITSEQSRVIADSGEPTRRRLRRQFRLTKTAARWGALTGATLGVIVGVLLLVLAGINRFQDWRALVVLAGGILICTAGGAVIGALFNMGFSHEEALLYDEALRSGAVIAAVEVPEEIEDEVVMMFQGHNARNVKKGVWRAAGWTHPWPMDSSFVSHPM